MPEAERRVSVRVAAKLYKAAKLKCVEDDLPLSDVVRYLLAGWVDGGIVLPQPTEAKAKPKREKP